VGQIVNGGCQFAIGKKDKPVHVTKQGYIAKLRWIDQRFVVMWDEEDKRGWLTKGTSALLHLLRASLEYSAKDRFSAEFLFDPKTFVEAAQRLRNDSAIEVLLNPANRKLRLYKLDEESFDDVMEKPDGTEEIITRTRRTYTTMEHRIVELFESLEKLIDHEAQGSASVKGVHMKPRLRSQLQGWDFHDVAISRDPLYLRVTTPPSSGRTWVDLVDSTRAVTLFGRGFGELIKPVWSTNRATQLTPWNTMPTGKGYLGACVADLKDMIENHGDKTSSPLTISRGVLWHNPSEHNIFMLSLHSKSSPYPAGWAPVQELLPAAPNLRGLLLRIGGSGKVDVDSCQHGAVIFGRSKSSKFTWPDLLGDLNMAGASADSNDGQDSPMQTPEILPAESSSAETGSSGTNAYLSVSVTHETQLTSPMSSRLSIAASSGSQHGSVKGSMGSAQEGPCFHHDPTSRKRGVDALSDEEESGRRGITNKMRRVNLGKNLRRGFQGAASLAKRGED